MGQLHVQKIELGEVIRHSTHVVIAVPDDPPVIEEQVVIKARGKKPPPYVRSVHRFRVRESLRGDLAPGAAIVVVPANDALQERLHRDYHTKGLSRHVAVDFYEPRSRFGDQEPRILFLAAHDGRFAYARDVGAEGLGMRGEVERQLGAKSVSPEDPREGQVNLALFVHGNFGVYGDLRTGLAAARKHSRVKFTDVANGVRVDIVPLDGHGHEYQFVVTRAGMIEGFMAAESDTVLFRQFALRDVQGLHGGRNAYVFPDGRVVVQSVTPTETGLHESRFEMMLTKNQQESLRKLLLQHPPSRIHIPVRPGIPDQARPEISLIAHDGTVTTVAKWDDDRHPGFDALYNLFLHHAQQAQKLKPVWDGHYASDWRPD